MMSIMDDEFYAELAKFLLEELEQYDKMSEYYMPQAFADTVIEWIKEYMESEQS